MERSRLNESLRVRSAPGLQQSLRRFLLWIGVATGFAPYIALNVGNTSALQLSQIALISAGILGLGASLKRLAVATYLLVIPLVISLFLLGMKVDPMLSISLGERASINDIFSILCLIGAAAIVDIEDLVVLLSALTTAFIANGAYGLYQYFEFHRRIFPFLSMYQFNRSFAGFSAATSQQYLQSSPRPMGLFPEPSAMSACVGPWLIVLLVGYALTTKANRRIGRLFRLSVFVAIVMSTLLLALSESGMAPIAIAGISVCTFYFAFARETSVRQNSGTKVVTERPSVRPLSRKLFVALAGIFVIGITALSSRLSRVGGSSSWDARWESIDVGLHLLPNSLATFVFGVGPGQSPLLLRTVAPAIIQFWGTTPIAAIDSITGVYFVETGLIGIAAWFILLVLASLRIMRAPFYRFLGFLVLFVWLVAAAGTTSYLSLTPIWLLFGLLLTWDSFMAIGIVAESETA
jgi:hypothetical protein